MSLPENAPGGPGSPRRPWTSEEINLLVSLKNKGYTFTEIGKRLGRSYYCCHQALYRYTNGKFKRKSYHHWTRREIEKLLSLRQQGESLPDCARMLGKTFDTVVWCWKVYGVPDPQNRARDHAQEILALHAKGLPTSEIARIVRLSIETIRLFLKAHGKRSNGLESRTARLLRKRRYALWKSRQFGKHLGQVYSDVIRVRAANMGWPEADGVAQARVLEALLARPATHIELAVLLGYRLNKEHSGALAVVLGRLKRAGLIIQKPNRTGSEGKFLYELLPSLLEKKYSDRGMTLPKKPKLIRMWDPD